MTRTGTWSKALPSCTGGGDDQDFLRRERPVPPGSTDTTTAGPHAAADWGNTEAQAASLPTC